MGKGGGGRLGRFSREDIRRRSEKVTLRSDGGGGWSQLQGGGRVDKGEHSGSEGEY